MPKLYFNDWPPHAPHDLDRRENTVVAARLMLNAAQTAPNAGGVSQIEAHLVYGYTEQDELARKMEEMAADVTAIEHRFKYEAVMVRESDCVILIGDFRAAETPMDASCGACGGKADCSFVYERRKTTYGLIDMTQRTNDWLIDGPLCCVRTGDLGYAMGSALFMANKLFVDARPFMTVGVAAKKLGYCPGSPIVIGILVASLAKNPYVDVHPDYHLVNLGKMVDSVRKQYALARQVGPDYRLRDVGAERWKAKREAEREARREEKKKKAKSPKKGADTEEK